MSDTTTPPIPALDVIEGPEYFDARAEGCAHAWPFPHHFYRVRLTHEGRTLETEWRQGTAHTSDPEAHAVIGCLLSDALGFAGCLGFSDWCADYGYSDDSIAARDDYEKVRQQTDALRDLLTAPVFDALMDDDEATYGDAAYFARAWARAFEGVTA